MSAEPLVRLAAPADARDLAVVHVTGWRAAYAGLMPDRVLAALDVDEHERTWRARLDRPAPEERTLVVAIDGRAIGFAAIGPSRDSDHGPGDAEVYALYLDPGAWGRGLGRALFAAAVDDLRRRGHAAVSLWVLETNARARRLYEAAGMRADGGVKDEVVDGAPLPHVRYRLPLGATGP